MPIADIVIRDAVARYDRERDRYLKLAARVSDICRSSIVEDNAIRAQVTFRTKTVRSFEGKLKRFARRADKNYTSVDEVFAGVGDFAGVRIATYRPEDERRVTDEIKKLFEGESSSDVFVDKKDKLAVNSYQFYRATHCQVFLRDEDLVGHYENLRGTSCEVQVCSMMAHVWNEIEHDIGYKPEGGGPGDAEKGLLEALGHLTRSGDAAITRLLAFRRASNGRNRASSPTTRKRAAGWRSAASARPSTTIPGASSPPIASIAKVNGSVTSRSRLHGAGELPRPSARPSGANDAFQAFGLDHLAPVVVPAMAANVVRALQLAAVRAIGMGLSRQRIVGAAHSPTGRGGLPLWNSHETRPL